MIERPVVHARDHEHGGADPIRIEWEDVGTDGGGGSGGGGIQFDTEPQVGGYLSVKTTGTAPSGYTMNFWAQGSGGIDLLADAVDNNEIAIGQLDQYGVGMGIFGHQGTVVNNSSGGIFLIRNQSLDDLEIYASGGGNVDMHSDNSIFIHCGDQIELNANDGTVIYGGGAMGIFVSDSSHTSTITFQTQDLTPDTVFKVQNVGGVWSYHIKTGATWVADL